MTPEERAHLEHARKIHRNLQQQLAEERARAGERDITAPKRTAPQFAAVQRHAAELWELGGRQRRPDAPEIACETCKGARWLAVRNTIPPRSVPCPACFYAWQAAKIARNWAITPKETEIGAKPFRRRPDAPELAQVYHALNEYAQAVVAGEADMFSITGPVGIGKTHLMLRLHALVTAKERGVIYRTATHIQRLLQTFGHDPESRHEADVRRERITNDLTRAPLLIVDEAEKATGEWFSNQMLDIINIRRNNGLATALAGNDLYLLPAPVLSRAQANTCYFFALADIADARPVLEGA